jgi:AmmeMemoRadiSam system protein B
VFQRVAERLPAVRVLEMISSSSRPSLRAVETIVVPDPRHGKLLVLRDTQGVTDAQAAIPPPLVPIVARFDGERTCAEIAQEVSAELGAEVPVELVVKLAQQLDDGLFLDGAAFIRAQSKVVDDFLGASVRPASHAGGAYHGDPAELARYLDQKCLAAANGAGKGYGRNGRRIAGLVAPHIDPWRGAVGYGHAYAALAASLPEEADTFVLFGTSHAPMRQHFALCKKAFATPLGSVDADLGAVDALAKRAGFDAYADEFNHKREHSLEFQVVFLKHLLGERPFRIVPILAGLGEHQARGSDPAEDARAADFLAAVGELVEARRGRAVVVAGADLAHVGPRFGDAAFGADERRELEEKDRASIALATGRDARAFWADVADDLDTRRVCGLAPIYSLLRTIPGSAAGELLHYEQTMDEDGSIVSHAAVGFFGT